MVQWIAILVVLVSLSGSSFSRSWVGFDDYDYSESSLADLDSNESNRKARHFSDHDAWDSDEDDSDSEHHGYGYEDDRPDQENHYGRDSEYSSHVDHGYNHHGHDHYHEKHGYDHHGYHDNKDTQNQPGSWGSYAYNQGHKNHETHIETPGHYHHEGHPGDHNKNPDPSWGSTHKIHANQGSSHYGPHGQPDQHHGSQGPDQAVNSRQNPQSDGPNDADRVLFPGSNNQIPTTRAPAVTTTQTTARPSTTTSRTTSTTRTPSTTRPSTTSTTTTRNIVINTTLLNLVLCVRTCPTTPEYNPVCGSNNVTYNNPGALQCAENCGVKVSLARRSPCPLFNPSSTTTTTTSTTTTTTSRPSTTTERSKSTLIPLDVLLSIFGQPTNTNTEEPEFDIDKRRKSKH